MAMSKIQPRAPIAPIGLNGGKLNHAVKMGLPIESKKNTCTNKKNLLILDTILTNLP